MADNEAQENGNEATSAENTDGKQNFGEKMRDTLSKAKDVAEKLKDRDYKADLHGGVSVAKEVAGQLKQHDFRAEVRDAFAEAKKNPASIWKKPEALRPGKELAIAGLAVAVVLFLVTAITSSSFIGFLCLVLAFGGLLLSFLGLKTAGRKIAIGGAVVGLLVVICAFGQMICGGDDEIEAADEVEAANTANGANEVAEVASTSRKSSSKNSAQKRGQYEEYEGEAASDAEEILDLAKAAKSLNVCGFYPGMSMANARILAKHYNLTDGDYRFQFNPVSGEAYLFRFSMNGACRLLETPMPDDKDAQEEALRLMVAELESQVGKFVGEDAAGMAWREAGSRDGFNVTLSLMKMAFDKIGALEFFDAKMQEEAQKIIVPFYNNKCVAEKKAELEAAGYHPRVVQLARGIDMMLSPMYDGFEKNGMLKDLSKEQVESLKKMLMSSFELTEAQWEAVTGRQPLRSIGPAYPVKWGESGVAGEFVQYPQNSFLAMLNSMSYVKKMDLLFEIPNEGIFKMFATKKRDDGTPIASDNLDSVAWYRGNSGNSPKPVGKKQANIFGLYDVLGNMSEAIKGEKGPAQFGGDYYDTTDFLLSKSPMVTLGTKRDALYQSFITLRLSALDVYGLEKGGHFYRGIELPGGIILPMKVINGDESVWWGIFEVTRAQWAAVMGSVPESDKEKAADGFIGLVALGSGGDDRWADKRHSPVVNVSWNDCQRFIAKLNELPTAKEVGVVFDLPTEKEWKDACLSGSAGDYGRFADGAEIAPDNVQQVAWFEKEPDNRVRQPGDEFLEKMAKARSAHEVGWKSPNFNGLYDMLGNVAEWTSSASGDDRIVCGGKGDALPPRSDCKATVKYPRNPEKGDAYLGLRVIARKK